MAESAPKLKLYYFDIYGRAEVIRILLTHAKVEFEDIRVTNEESAKMKAEGKLEFGQLPVIEKEGHFYPQTAAILRFLGKKFGYYPEDAKQAYYADSAVDGVADMVTKAFRGMFETDPEKKKELMTDLVTNYLPFWFGVYEKRLLKNESSKKHLVGDKYTIADFAFAAWLFSSIYNEGNERREVLQGVLSSFPTL